MVSTGSPETAVDDNLAGADRDTAEIRYPATPLQQGLLFHSGYEPGSSVDVIQIVIGWPEPLDQRAMMIAWQAAAQRHPALRTSFAWSDGQPVQQVVNGAAAIPVDARDAAPDQLEQFLATDRAQEFKPHQAPPARVTLLRHAADRHTIVFTFHHAILDGRSVRMLLTEVGEEYHAIRRGAPYRPPRRPPFPDFAGWLNRRSPDIDRGYWQERLHETVLPTPLPLRPVTGLPPRRPESMREIVTTLGESERAALRQAAESAGVSLSTLLHAAWAVLLHRYSGEQDVVFGVARSCRRDTSVDADQIIGLVINTVPLRITVNADLTVRDWLRRVRTQLSELGTHQLTPLETIHKWSGLHATTPLFESLLMYEHRDMQTSLAELAPDWRGRTVQVRRHPNPPLTICAFGEPLRIFLYHDRRRLSDEAADHMLRQLTTCLLGMITGLDEPVAALPLTDAAEARRLIREWSGNHPAYPADATVPAVFAAQARLRPDAVAVTGADGSLTYAQLDAQANRLAHLLVRRGVTTDTPVAVVLPRSVRTVVALLAILKAGGAYLPIDPTNPPSRIRELLAASGNPLVLCADGAPIPSGTETVRLDLVEAELAALPDHPPPATASPISLAYISYTSGSTGTPKGVAVPHRAVLRLIHEPDYLRLGPDESVLHLAPTAFDASTLEIWGALLNGARLVVAPPDPLGPAEIARLLRTERISVLWLTAGLFHQMVEQIPDCLADVDQLLSGGDVLSPTAVRDALRVRQGQPLINGYGPTENTTFTCCHRMTDPQQVPDPVPIGRPVPRSTVYVLDAALRPVPVGVPGELYTGGDGLARGYLGRPGLTAERFLPDPFSITPGARMYRTGDRVRWRPDGTLEFLGRVDRQVKIRGFRVEPAEVEAVLRAHPLVREVAVTVTGNGERRRLLAYLSPAAGAPDGQRLARTLAAHAAAQLPPYLRPADYVVLPALPLNRNGKVDRAALPDPVPAQRTAVAEHPLTDPTQARLAPLWTELLSIPVVAPDDDFFAVGGNSLLATRLAFRIADRFGVELPIRDLYEHRTLAGLAAQIDRAARPSAVERITARDRAAFRTDTGRSHLVQPTPGPWALWRWIGLRAAGFPIRPLIELGDAEHAAVADALLASRDEYARAAREMLQRIREARLAAPPAQRGRWNRVEQQVRRGKPPQTMPQPADPVLADRLLDARRALVDVLARRQADEQRFARSHDRTRARLATVLRTAAGDPAFREAVTWQNRHALRTGLDPLLRAAPDQLHRSKHRQHCALVAAYLQRYCAKNDTIGFFGPVGWADVADRGAPLWVSHGTTPLLTRTVFFENWAITELAEAITGAEPRLRPWLIPRRLPFVAVVDGRLLLPLTPPTPLPPAVARLLAACDGVRNAAEIAAELVADPDCELDSVDEVYRLLARLRDERRISWSLEVPKEDLFPERAVRERLTAIPDPEVAGPALATLELMEQARERVVDATGDAARLEPALAELEATFTKLTGAAPTRRAGQVYAGRTLVYEDCRSSTEVGLSPELVATLWPALSLLLESARWFTFAGAALFRRACQERYQELAARTGSETVPLADFWHWANDLLFALPEKLITPVVRGLQDRWTRILSGAAHDGRRIRLDSDAIADRVREVFAAPRPGWMGAYQHSPDIMLAAASPQAVARGDFHWVVGEMHPGLNTLRSAVFATNHPQPGQLVEAMAADLPGPRITLAATGEEGGSPARLTDKLITERDRRLMFGHDSCGLDPRTAVAIGDCVVEPRRGGLWVRSRDHRFEVPLAEVLGEPLMLQVVQRFDIRPPADHQPRITVDRVVIARESWRFAAADLTFVHTTDEAERFLQVRRWQLDAGLPRYVFVKTPAEKKPFFLDFTSLAAIDGFARSVRRVLAEGDAGATVRLTEMLPTPDQLWLTDAAGERHTAEFRLVAVDTRTEPDPHGKGSHDR
ncbi:MAG TPA: amino acid adenylation domain-containing protein [Micromonosporaceae bacterium]